LGDTLADMILSSRCPYLWQGGFRLMLSLHCRIEIWRGRGQRTHDGRWARVSRCIVDKRNGEKEVSSDFCFRCGIG
jgi:pyridoxine/pyridoxamine 5'-phosphate oxidase